MKKLIREIYSLELFWSELFEFTDFDIGFTKDLAFDHILGVFNNHDTRKARIFSEYIVGEGLFDIGYKFQISCLPDILKEPTRYYKYAERYKSGYTCTGNGYVLKVAQLTKEEYCNYFIDYFSRLLKMDSAIISECLEKFKDNMKEPIYMYEKTRLRVP